MGSLLGDILFVETRNNRFTHAGREDHEHVEGDEHEVDHVEPRALQAARAEADRGRPPRIWS